MDNENFNLIVPLWDEARKTEEEVKQKKKDIFKQIKDEYPTIKFRAYGSLNTAFKTSKLDSEIAMKIEGFIADIDAKEARAKWCRAESGRLRALKELMDTRKVLDPKIDIVPNGEYPKIKVCKAYPLRQSCNHGEDSVSKWSRCEYMQYDDSQHYLSSSRWMCCEPVT
ncbi:hypothetical protein [Shewanella sp. ALD9]|uniref:hypothetical protein n=1 Tax=Shewanella sp. ALD9 TaxID=2058330 RepID=UPI000C3449FA|nr:hypothetical protein [Shewanella sp. ALD9]PKH31494.1 hypothetical protein CXF88_13185 [Shewanella sp. ALD9]